MKGTDEREVTREDQRTQQRGKERREESEGEALFSDGSIYLRSVTMTRVVSAMSMKMSSRIERKRVSFLTFASLIRIRELTGGVTVERLLEALLVEVVTDESDRATEDEQTVESSNLEVLVGLLASEGAGSAEEIAEEDGDGLLVKCVN